MKQNTQMTERRQYYRLNNNVIFNYRIIKDDETDTHDNTVSAAFEMIELFGQINQQMRTTMGRISEKSADIASYLKSLDSKLELLAEMSLFKESQSALGLRQNINLGAGGLSFCTDEDLKSGTLLAIDMILSTDLTCLHLMGSVVAIVDNNRGEYAHKVSLAFVNISALEEDHIVKHIMHLQSEQLRIKKEVT